ncbi:hypothetical protein Rhe02_79510 [Rhizocola hellebori]|uniref:Uncharacterized protein n=1 Tax=Rhizocola hellebori TaxID=1392758 RepID=A0A8J3QFE4_9ACTN|nr:hypothetical protein Rhe02_79510 [Rhizocola hellebori]
MVREIAYENGQVRNDFEMASNAQSRFDVAGPRRQLEFLQSSHFSARGLEVPHIAQGRPTPQIERLAQCFGGQLRVVALKPSRAFSNKRLKLEYVKFLCANLYEVPGGGGDKKASLTSRSSVGFELLTQAGDVRLDHQRRRTRGSSFGP